MATYWKSDLIVSVDIQCHISGKLVVLVNQRPVYEGKSIKKVMALTDKWLTIMDRQMGGTANRG